MSHLGQRLSALIDGELSAAERDRVLAHVARCEGCRQEAAALRALKQRMHSLGEAMVDTALTGRLMAMAASGGAQHAPGWRPRALYAAARWVAAGLVASAMAGVGTAAFFVGGEQQDPGPKVTPAVDTFLVQHGIVTGDVPVPAASAEPSSPALSSPDASGTGPSSTGLGGAGTAARRTGGAA
ncbi:MAG: anti-sigma factor family protein, partial [Streptosporangiales bacterium]